MSSLYYIPNANIWVKYRSFGQDFVLIACNFGGAFAAVIAATVACAAERLALLNRAATMAAAQWPVVHAGIPDQHTHGCGYSVHVSSFLHFD